MRHKLRLVVLGMMGRCPFGGQTWLYLNWLLGLRKLGHEVWYIEDDTVWPYDPERDSITDDCSYAVRHIAGCMKRIGLPQTWGFRAAYRGEECYGVTSTQLDELYRTCDALLNVVGATDLRAEHLAAPLRVYVECDPVIAELQLANGDAHTTTALENHHGGEFVTVRTDRVRTSIPGLIFRHQRDRATVLCRASLIRPARWHSGRDFPPRRAAIRCL